MSPLGSRGNPEDVGHGIADAYARVVTEAAHLGLDVDPIGYGVADTATLDRADVCRCRIVDSPQVGDHDGTCGSLDGRDPLLGLHSGVSSLPRDVDVEIDM
jgi:hypothetical protein